MRKHLLQAILTLTACALLVCVVFGTFEVLRAWWEGNREGKVNIKNMEKGGPGLVWAVEMGKIELAEQMIKDGADVNEVTGRSTNPVLVSACNKGDNKMVAMLIENGADVSKGDPLARAASRNHLEIAKMLLDAGADPNHLESGEIKPLKRALDAGHTEMAKLLIERGAQE